MTQIECLRGVNASERGWSQGRWNGVVDLGG